MQSLSQCVKYQVYPIQILHSLTKIRKQTEFKASNSMNKNMVQQTYSPKSLENTPFHSKMTFLGVLCISHFNHSNDNLWLHNFWKKTDENGQCVRELERIRYFLGRQPVSMAEALCEIPGPTINI